jgi:hypothetical protein
MRKILPMKKVLPLLFLVLFFSCKKKEKEPEPEPGPDHSFRGNIISYQLLASYSVQQVDSVINSYSPYLSFILQAQYPMDVYKVVYETIDVKGTAIIASGALCIPRDNSTSFPIASYQHATALRKQDVPSEGFIEVSLGIIIGSLGYVMAMPDYLGMGSSPGTHPYMHAKSEATAVVDMLRAGRKVTLQEGAALNGKVFLLGYSQGAHATMAALREIELYHSIEFNLAACAPMSGPYDIAGVQLDSLLRDKSNKGASVFIPYTYMGYKDIYNLPSYENVFVSPYDTLVPFLFDGTHSYSYVNSFMPDTPNTMLQPSVLNGLLAHNNANPFYKALLENNVYNWKPVTPLKIIYCEGDELVFFQNSIAAYNYFISAGSTSVSKQKAGTYSHEDCTLFALLAARTFFQQHY